MKTDIWTQKRIVDFGAKHWQAEVTVFEDVVNTLSLITGIGDSLVLGNPDTGDKERIGAAAVAIITIADQFATQVAFAPEASYAYSAKDAFASLVDCFGKLPHYALYFDDKTRTFNGTILVVAQANFNQMLSHLAKLCSLLDTDLQTQIDAVMDAAAVDLESLS
jgi:hypothetical protein